eukprot:m.201576 g.201576  ORF g.201576 m.201576 type:complete len:199 (-) comp15507_c2_seq1:73-669(-)
MAVVRGVFLLLALAAAVHGYAILIDAHAEECYYETARTGTKMSLTFQVAEGGFLDIDVSIVGPDGKVIYSGERETDGKYTFSAHIDGEYKYCFSNAMSTLTTKLVVFSIIVGPEETELGSDAHHDKLSDMTRELSEALHNVMREQEYMEVRDRTHQAINDSTNTRVVWWSFFETLVLVSMTAGQIYFLRRFFEVRTTV